MAMELFSGHEAVRPEFKIVSARRSGQTQQQGATGKQDAAGERKQKEGGAGRGGRRRTTDPREGRTVFVGNCPATVTRRKLRRLFQEHGKVASVRLRSIVVEKGKLPVKVAKRMHKQVTGNTVNGYVVFESEESAEKALALNGEVLGGRHLRVDLVGQSSTHKHKRSVFVGNLPFTADEEEVRGAFAECGEIEAVRVVRERKTNTGKGFGFVTFKDRSGVMFALQQNGKVELDGKKLRVFKSRDMSQGEGGGSVARFSGMQAKGTLKQRRQGGMEGRGRARREGKGERKREGKGKVRREGERKGVGQKTFRASQPLRKREGKKMARKKPAVKAAAKLGRKKSSHSARQKPSS